LAAQTSNLHFFKKQGDAGKLGVQRMDDLMRRSWGLFEQRLLETRGWALERGLSVVDAHFYPYKEMVKFPKVREWFEKLDAMQEVKRAYERVSDGEKM
jgi:glutathione S-transferase